MYEIEFINQMNFVINKLELEHKDEIKNGIIKLIYDRYKKALNILKNNSDIKEVNIIGGVKAYMDSYNDYYNLLLKELHKAEELYKKVSFNK